MFLIKDYGSHEKEKTQQSVFYYMIYNAVFYNLVFILTCCFLKDGPSKQLESQTELNDNERGLLQSEDNAEKETVGDSNQSDADMSMCKSYDESKLDNWGYQLCWLFKNCGVIMY